MRLIDADALDKRIYNDVPISTFGSIRRMAAVRNLIEEAPTVEPAQRWHRVEERLPDDSRDVIIFTASRIIGVGSFIRPNWYQWYSGGGIPVDVTHWMEMPEPPKEEE